MIEYLGCVSFQMNKVWESLEVVEIGDVSSQVNMANCNLFDLTVILHELQDVSFKFLHSISETNTCIYMQYISRQSFSQSPPNTSTSPIVLHRLCKSHPVPQSSPDS